MEPLARTTDETERALARELSAHVAAADRPVVLRWARELMAIRESGERPLHRAARALEATYQREVMLALLSGAGRSLKEIALGDRSWAAQLGLGAAAATAMLAGGQAAGLAALGTAVGVPLWMVLGAGGSFVGVLVDELSAGRALDTSAALPREHEDDVVDAEWEFAPADEQPAALLPPPPAGDSAEPLLQVFRRAYRDARRRQRDEP